MRSFTIDLKVTSLSNDLPINGWSLCKKRTKGGIKVNESFFYTSDNNPNWLKNAELNEWLRSNDNDS